MHPIRRLANRPRRSLAAAATGGLGRYRRRGSSLGRRPGNRRARADDLDRRPAPRRRHRRRPAASRSPTCAASTKEGAYAGGVRDALPTVTYPNHTTLITGVWPARHGIASNTEFRSTRKNMGGWYWYPDIKVPTLGMRSTRRAARAPASSLAGDSGRPSIDYDIPEYWRAHNAEDAKLLRALATPGLVDPLETSDGDPLLVDDEADTDEGECRPHARRRPIRPSSLPSGRCTCRALDHAQHDGPDTPERQPCWNGIDAEVGE